MVRTERDSTRQLNLRVHPMHLDDADRTTEAPLERRATASTWARLQGFLFRRQDGPPQTATPWDDSGTAVYGRLPPLGSVVIPEVTLLLETGRPELLQGDFLDTDPVIGNRLPGLLPPGPEVDVDLLVDALDEPFHAVGPDLAVGYLRHLRADAELRIRV